MAKVARAYWGENSYGVSIEVAQSESGAWYWREYRWNGYGKGWSKWAFWKEEVVFPTRLLNKVECADAPEYYEIPEEQRENIIEWGFNILRKFKETPKFRLPA